jgi:hypothetical protein
MTLAGFSVPRRRDGRLPLLIAALALVLALALPLLPPLVIRASADTLFAALIFHGLLAARLPHLHVLAIAALVFAQAGVFLSATGRAGSIWLGLAVYCVASAASGFVKHRDTRHVMLLGGALSLAQLLDPMGALLSVFLLPVCVGLPREGEMGNKAGLFVLLLFIPVVTAIVLATVRGVLDFDPLHFARAGLDTRPIAHASLILLLVAGFATAPVLWLTVLVADLRRPAGLIAVYAGLAVLAAMALAYLFGAKRDLASAMIAACAASSAALCAWPRLARKGELAIAATALSAVVSWLVINFPSLVI